jgi:hypothetical protein
MPLIIFISNSKEEVEMIPQLVAKKQSPQVPESKPMEKLSCSNL